LLTTDRNGANNREATQLSTSNIIQSVERNGNDTRTSQTNNSSEIKNLVSSGHNLIMSTNNNQFNSLGMQSSNNYASLLLEQQKTKECLAKDICDLKSQTALATSEAKYEALKNAQNISAQLSECCCEIKGKVDQRVQDVTNFVSTLDTNRLRDQVVSCNNDVSSLKLENKLEHILGSHGGHIGHGGYGGYGGHGGHGGGHFPSPVFVNASRGNDGCGCGEGKGRGN
jgi:hypothetical protein